MANTTRTPTPTPQNTSKSSKEAVDDPNTMPNPVGYKVLRADPNHPGWHVGTTVVVNDPGAPAGTLSSNSLPPAGAGERLADGTIVQRPAQESAAEPGALLSDSEVQALIDEGILEPIRPTGESRESAMARHAYENPPPPV